MKRHVCVRTCTRKRQLYSYILMHVKRGRCIIQVRQMVLSVSCYKRPAPKSQTRLETDLKREPTSERAHARYTHCAALYGSCAGVNLLMQCVVKSRAAGMHGTPRSVTLIPVFESTESLLSGASLSLSLTDLSFAGARNPRLCVCARAGLKRYARNDRCGDCAESHCWHRE